MPPSLSVPEIGDGVIILDDEGGGDIHSRKRSATDLSDIGGASFGVMLRGIKK